MERPTHERDAATGRPVRDSHELIDELSDEELKEELLVAAMARDHRRIDRFKALLDERNRRHPNPVASTA